MLSLFSLTCLPFCVWGVNDSRFLRPVKVLACQRQTAEDSLLVRPTKGSTAPTSLCLRSPLFGDLTWISWSRKSWEGPEGFTTRGSEDEEWGGEDVLLLLPSLPSDSKKKIINQILFFNEKKRNNLVISAETSYSLIIKKKTLKKMWIKS